MQIYLVGGAIRDRLLGLPVKEQDWVVEGSTPQAMLDAGYKAVGKDFPVFIHPQSGEEYALARTERKTGPGYGGFSFHAAPDVSLTDDLKRRDLTINAIAEDTQGQLIDPYHGQADINARVLRHVSPAFVEDPVRVLRVARFKARFHALGFSIAPETLNLMHRMVQQGEVHALTPERVWQELHKALVTDHPSEFFVVLAQCGALAVLFPQLQNADTALASLDFACTLSDDPLIRLASLLGACAQLNDQELKALASQYRIPKHYYELSRIVHQNRDDYAHALALDAQGLLDMLNAMDAFRKPARCQAALQALQATQQTTATSASDRIWHAYQCAAAVDVAAIVAQGLQGKAIQQELQCQRLLAIAHG